MTEDTIQREVKDGKLYSKRILTKTNRVPKWGERFISTRVVKIIEESIVDPNEKLLVTYTRNIGLARIMESIFYYLYLFYNLKIFFAKITVCVCVYL